MTAGPGPSHGSSNKAPDPHSAAASGHVHVTAAPSVSAYEQRRASVKLAKSQLVSATANFDNPALEPLVQAQYHTLPGEIPRRIQIERKKRLYAEQSLEALLRARGIDPCSTGSSALAAIAPTIPALPLQVFDSEDFESRSAEAWLRLAAAGGGGLPARALYVLPDSLTDTHNNGNSSKSNNQTADSGDSGGGSKSRNNTSASAAQWRECRVTGRDKDASTAAGTGQGLWHVEWLEGSAREAQLQTKKPRIHVYFRAEDPFRYTEGSIRTVFVRCALSVR